MNYTPKDHSFVICAYKENPYLEATILSLQQQSLPSTVMLSTSTPNEHIKDICKKHNVEVFVNESPHLAGDDWNYALKMASTPLVTLAHQDDLYEPEFLSNTLDAANRTHNIAMLFTDSYELRNHERVEQNMILRVKRVMNIPFRFKFFNGSKFIKTRVLSFGNPICCPAVTLNKALVGDGVFDTTYKNSCDYKTWVDMARRSGRFVYVPKMLVGHRIYEESATSRNLADNTRQKEDLMIFEELWPKPIARIIYRLFALSEKSNDLES